MELFTELSTKPTPMSRSSHLTRTIRKVVTTKEALEIRNRSDMVMTEAVIASKQINAIRDSKMIVEETRDNRMIVKVIRDNRMTVEEINRNVTREIAAIQRILVTLVTLVTQETLATKKTLVTLVTQKTLATLVILVTQEILVTRSKATDKVIDHLNSNVINVIAEISVTNVIAKINVISVINVINVTKDKATKDKETDRETDKVINMVTDRVTDKLTRDRAIDNSQDRKMTDKESPPSLCQPQRK